MKKKTSSAGDAMNTNATLWSKPTRHSKIVLNGVIAHGLTSSRHEAQFHLPTESGGCFSEVGHNERWV